MAIISIGHRLTILKGVYDVKIKQEIPIDSDHWIPPCKTFSVCDCFRYDEYTNSFKLPMLRPKIALQLRTTYPASSNPWRSVIIVYKLSKLKYERWPKNTAGYETSFYPWSERSKTSRNPFHTIQTATAPIIMKMECHRWFHSCHQKGWAAVYPVNSPPNDCSSAQRRRAVPRPIYPSQSLKGDPWLMRIWIPQQLPSPLQTTSLLL